MVVPFLWLALVESARAGGAVDAAEVVRLGEDLRQLAQRQAWNGVERVYRELERRGAELDYDQLVLGAYAARSLGHVRDVRDRLALAVKIRPSRQVVDWLSDIDASYAPVALLGAPHCGLRLEPVELPFDPDQRRAIEAAMDDVDHEGSFTGLLPRGGYQFGGQAFFVEPGIALRIEVDTRSKRDRSEPP